MIDETIFSLLLVYILWQIGVKVGGDSPVFPHT